MGWIRANSVASEDALTDLNDLRKENDKLRAQLKLLGNREPNKDLNLVGLDEIFSFKVGSSRGQGGTYYETLSASWSEIFSVLAPDLLEQPVDDIANKFIAQGIYRLRKDTQDADYSLIVVGDDFSTIRVQLTALKLVVAEKLPTTKGSFAVFWSLTPKGQQLMLQLRTVTSTKTI